MSPSFRASCIITCHNYANFVGSAIRSALEQDEPFQEIVIVDDASTDRSVEIIQSVIIGSSNCRLICRAQNGGQLRAFEEGVAATSGDWVFFLDADDFYASDWTSAVRELLTFEEELEFVYSLPIHVDVDADASSVFDFRQARSAQWSDQGCTLIRTWVNGCFVGAPTSALCLSRSLLQKLFPAINHEQFTTRADDWMVFGASLLGSRKVRVNGHYVAYRQHGSNAWAANTTHGRPRVFYGHQLAVHRIFRELARRSDFDARFLTQAHIEFKTCPQPDIKLLMTYIAIVLRHSSYPISRRLAIGVMIKHFLSSRKPRAGGIW